MNTQLSPRPPSHRSSLALRVLAVAFGTALGCTLVQAQVSVSNLWSISTAAGRIYVTNQPTERGIAYNPATGHTILVSRSGGQRVIILDSDTGAELGTVNADNPPVNGGTYSLNMIGAADDGGLYLGNLSGSATATPTYRLYRYTNESALPLPVYVGNPAGGTNMGRWGDNLDVRGSGINTEILITSDGVLGAILRPTDEAMTNFTASPFVVSGAAAQDFWKGVTFYTNNTFIAKRWGNANARLVQYDLASGTASVIATFATDMYITGIDVDPANNILAGIHTSTATGDGKHFLAVYDLSESPPVIFDTLPFPTPYANNANAVGGIDMRAGRIVAVDTVSGVLAAGYSVATGPVPPRITAQPPNRTVVQGGYTSLSAAAAGTKPRSYQWIFNGTEVIPDATNTTLLLTNVLPSQAGDYTLRVTNIVGSIDSAAGRLTVSPAVLSDAMTKLWGLSPGDRPYLTTDDRQRGMAYNPVNNHLLLVSRSGSNAVHVLDASTGDYLWTLDANPTVITGGALALNLVAATADGTVYAGNVTLDGTTNSFRLYKWFDDNPSTPVELAWQGDPGEGATNRWGDAMVLRGSDAEGTTQILLGSRGGKAVSILLPLNLSAVRVEVPSATGGNFGLGVAWGEGDTFWGKSSGQSLRHVAMDLTAVPVTATTLQNFTGYPNMAGIAVEPVNQFLVGYFIETPDNVRLFEMFNWTTLFERDTDFFPTDNANGNGTSAIALGGGKVFVLGSNNGLMAFALWPRIRSTRVDATTLQLEWDFPYVLQSSTTVNGVYSDVTSASPYQADTTQGTAFYRLRN